MLLEDINKFTDQVQSLLEERYISEIMTKVDV